MKKAPELIFISILLLTLGSCGTQPNQSDLKKMNLKGEVVLIKEGKDYIFFNDDGNIQKKYSDENSYKYIDNFFYIEKKLNKRTTFIIYESHAKTQVSEKQINFHYDKDGNLTFESTIYKSDNVLSAEDLSTLSHNRYYFYENGKIITDSSFTKSLNIETRVERFKYDGELLIRSEFERKLYESMGEFKNGKNESSNKNIYYYENGLLIKEISDENQTYKYLYENDVKGNWTKQNRSDGKVFYREIFYKGDDISFYENKFEEIKKEISSTSSENNNNLSPKINNEIVPEEKYIQSNINPQKVEIQTCRKCQGTGSVSCDRCAGRGETRCFRCSGNGLDSKGNKCIWCKGGFEECTGCRGSGKVGCRNCSGRGHL
jgi:hypothetical protein